MVKLNIPLKTSQKNWMKKQNKKPNFQLTVSAKEDLKNIARYTEKELGVAQRNFYLTPVALKKCLKTKYHTGFV